MNAENAFEAVFEHYKGAGRDKLIPLLQDIQEINGYLSRDNIKNVAGFLNISEAKVFGVASFYNQFKFTPPGKYHIQTCRGTACHVKGSLAILNAIQKELKILPGQTTKDGIFSLEIVACIGACGLAPVISIDGNFHAGVSVNQIPEILAIYKEREAVNGK